MTATATTTDNKVDPREVPGGGRLNPVDHIVRIVVVRRRASDSTAARESDAGESHGLTNDELSAAEDELKKKAPPPSPEATPAARASSDAQSSNAKNMFEALKPTDIVVVGREPASVRKLKEGRTLSGHDDHHRDTVLRVWTESDTIEYQCEERFEIVNMQRAGWKIHGAPENPFESKGQPPYRAEQRQRPTDGKLIWSWMSGQLPAKANNQQYKMTFKVFDEHGENGELVDPDVVCGDPPPLP